ncbi:F0F1 ATP synthase subunit A [Candidatus Daviesbacteria bacterium]|nr:F0F1 ATP synthase subunit A [Candidatus Daviesbacteria bacterium]
MEHTIILASEKIAQLGPIPLTNTLMVSLMVTFLLTIVSILATLKVKLVPSGLQNFLEVIIEVGYTQVEELAHLKAKVFFPWVMTFFLFIITANWLGLFPGFGTVGFWEHQDGKEVFVPLLRSINSDLNMTLSLALVSAITTHILAIKFLGLMGYLKRWFSLQMFPVFLFVGFLEVISEFTKVVSLSFRLFGNIFAGEVVLVTVATISKWTAFFVPLPFLFLEIIVGFVQAAVFMMLTLVFMVLLTEKGGH